MTSDRFVKRPVEPGLLKILTANAFLDHDLDGILDLFPSREPLHVLIDHLARLWGAGITGSSSQTNVRLPAVISLLGLVYLIFFLLVGKVVTYFR